MPECKKCGKCCEYAAFALPDSIPNDLKEYYEAHGFIVLPDKNTLLLKAPCKHLKDGLCSIHESKPKICTDFGPGNLSGSLVISKCAYASLALPNQIVTLPEE